ncbi:unnamed protein product [Camellia sinensis]
MLSIAELKGVAEKKVELAIEFVVTVAEDRKQGCGMIEKLDHDLTRLLSVLLNKLVITEDDSSWYKADSDNNDDYKVGKLSKFCYGNEDFSRLTVALHGNAIVSNYQEELPNFLVDKDWRKRHGATIKVQWDHDSHHSSSLRKMGDDNIPINFGIIGCAEIARKVSRAINLSPNSTLHAIASRSIEKAKQFALKNGLSETVKIYGSYDQLLDDPRVDAVYLPLPTSLHVQWAVLAAQKRKHLLMEKPTALDVEELDQILDACESNGLQFMDGTMWHHHPRTAKMKELASDPLLFGQLKWLYNMYEFMINDLLTNTYSHNNSSVLKIHSSSTFTSAPEFFENNVRVKPDMDPLGALGDTGWYCIGAILWAMNYQLPTTVVALPATARNSAGVILSCSASLHWDTEQIAATFHCSFLSHESMDLALYGSNGSLHVEDFIIPYEENSAFFDFTSGAKFVDLHIGWNVKPQRVQVASQLPQEALMVQEFSRLVKGIRDSKSSPDSKWAKISRSTQLVMDAVKKSIDLGFEPVCL